ncbi:MAG: 4-(cytidine 5'-diphospho)-2-C-methyl-D-erythritol kinase [Candidatus Omnitrophica bacterium]|nr:4-(cytidine 5'-diphospho)-2-C-methyl-D-erythritol kinase [Candidatus Omnitrophota bacterium]
MDKLTLASYAKLNLYLEVLGKRKDNYHNLSTIFERISLSDKIILKTHRDDQITIVSSSGDIPKDDSNLCAKAARLLQAYAYSQPSLRAPKPACRQGRGRSNLKNGIASVASLPRNDNCLGVDITIIKRIPVGSGMGGGSSNAALTLLGLNKLWGLRLSRNKLALYARKIGADVPFFLRDCRFALGGRRGDHIKPLIGLKNLRLWHVIVVPRIKVSTPFIYKKWDEFRARARSEKVRLTLPEYDANILNLALIKKDFSLLQKALFNSLQDVTFRLYPELKIVKASLKKLGLKSILMSGSGPAVFGIVSSRKEAVFLAEQLKKKHKSWRIFSASSV